MEATSEELFGQRESQLKLASKETRSFGGRKVILASNELLFFEASFGWLSSEQWSPMEATTEELFGQRESQLQLKLSFQRIKDKATRSFELGKVSGPSW